MADLTTVAAAVLGIGLGAFAIAFPGAIIRINLAGRGPPGRHGEYGSSGFPGRWRRVVRAIGVVVLLLGVYFGYLAVS